MKSGIDSYTGLELGSCITSQSTGAAPQLQLRLVLKLKYKKTKIRIIPILGH